MMTHEGPTSGAGGEAAAGGWTAGWTASATPSPTSSPPPTYSPARAGRHRTGSSRTGFPRAACCRARFSPWRRGAGGGGGRGPVRGLRDHHAGPGHPAHRQRVGRVGRPQGSRIRAYMESYSPYDNVPAGPRPDLLVTGSLHDPRVLIHEPAKWAARLRATSGTGDRSDGDGGTGIRSDGDGGTGVDGTGDGASGDDGTGRLLFRPELGAGAHVGP